MANVLCVGTNSVLLDKSLPSNCSLPPPQPPGAAAQEEEEQKERDKAP